MTKPYAFIGFGAMARHVERIIGAQDGDKPRLVGVLEAPGAVEQAKASLGKRPPVFTTIEDLLAGPADVIAECAGGSAFRAYGERVLLAGKDLIAISMSAFCRPGFAERLETAAKTGGGKLILPAGALGGIDAIASARLGGLKRVTLTSTKPARAWRGTLAESRVDLDHLTQRTVFFSGSSREAASTYPKNANVAATLALAGLGLDATKVRLVADPRAKENTHRIEAEGAFGRMVLELSGNALPDNPKTSMLAALSVARALLEG